MPQIAQARGIAANSLGELTSNVTVATIVRQFDGAALLRALEAATARLEAGADEVNALNVYPVPDGDTGTNMLHTMRAAVKHARDAEPTIDKVSAAAAYGALMGARGNSGVILSQVVRGLKEAFAGKQTAGVADVRRAAELARKYAYEAVSAPAPGTILTLTASFEKSAAADADDVVDMFRRIATDAQAAVMRTRDENPTNRAAGVVDAGARGLQLILEGVLSSFTGAEIPIERMAPAERPAGQSSVSEAPSWEGAYDVQFLVENPSRPVAAVREEMLKFGADCVLVVGDEQLLKVHVHTLEPDQIVRIGLTAGRIADVVVEDLDAMTAEHERATGIVVESAPRAAEAAVGVVAVVPGEGFAAVARSLGASPLRGGPTMNPSTEELLAAITAANAKTVIVLPNDKNVILAAQQAAKVSSIGVHVVPTRNVAQGMAALVAFDPAKGLADNAKAMGEVALRAHGIEVTRAVRDATIDGEQVRKGEAMALLDGRVVAHGEDEETVLVDAAKRLTDSEIFTLYSGADVDDARVQHAAQRLRAACPRVSVEVAHGGQPHYPFIVAAE
ncbi:MAG TPA: DAK2 domain-containing protein [Candidatus Polarisedimenticolia bacterium]|nr:DAK2 domain-containing protein [Candidatus Polarisedimenticolia bacterium]